MSPSSPGGGVDHGLDRLRRRFGEFDVYEEETVVPRSMYTDCLRSADRDALGGARVFLVRDGEVALVRYADEQTAWDLPGGPTDVGERYVGAAQRHVREDVGVECELTGVFRVVRRTFVLVEGGEGVSGHWVFFEADPADGALRPGEGVATAEWFDLAGAPPATDRHVAARFLG